MAQKTKKMALERDFHELIKIIETAKLNAYKAVNKELINLYWNIGEYVSNKVSNQSWGSSIVGELAKFIQKQYVGIRGFSASNIWRMKQFYETYMENEFLATLSRELSWSNNILIMAGAKTDEAKEFYINLAIKYSYSARELERQIDSLLYERTMITAENKKLQLMASDGLSSLRDNYVLEFLDIPKIHKESELRKAIVTNLKSFILEFGKDFSFIAEEYKIQVGNTDFYIDLLFYNRELSCLVAIELKTGKFKPEYLGQLEFYLEALDRDVKKSNENPSVGLILCTAKDDAVVEYAISRSMSPAMVGNYQLNLPDKKVLQNKLKELRELSLGNDDEQSVANRLDNQKIDNNNLT